MCQSLSRLISKYIRTIQIMSRIFVKRITNPTAATLDSIVAVVTRAYAGQKAIELFTGGDLSLTDSLWRSQIRAGLNSGEVWIATDGTEEIMSVGVWFGPGKELYDTREVQEYLTLLSEEGKNWWTHSYRPNSLKFFERCLGKKTRKENWFANIICTDPRYEGRGLATSHIEAVYKRAIEASSYLALGAAGTSLENFYLSAGFWERGRTGDGTTDWVCFVKGNTY
ncbi:hypothetical protein BDP27DRAFT_1313051 [Rhodocollybia butyracea]|uniref:N-acetyltransferase domain-containing protein n=1 Tax=Rhodocollybia butyracea TaxID=206335 RepID=A0A9P5Q9B8_9AGAR|nr:hypothetical protein BDP27DRAFT_1313051 [Rhodocollybia butyracea]